ncbi:multidrug efflux RND transporter permease subunit [Rhodoligotrophos ferricapiens]|uniref:multidrug efflux RND transporter permease subunit n=1 Tax=Rhodoligotrophos ferricapiens TaxID=3069264 RepID=UPI00315C7643
MTFTDIFIKRPVLATVVSLMILLVGLGAMFSLQIRQYPELTNTTITITTTYPGANADLIKGFITTPIQQAVASTEGVDTLVSSSTQNTSTVTLNLRLNADPDRAATDVLSKINQIRGELPEESNDPVVVKQTGDAFALMYIGFNSDTMTGAQITDYLTRVVQPRLQTINGVSNAQILGGQTFAMRAWLKPDKMAALGVTPTDVATALAANNFTSAAGQVKGDFVQTTINADTSLTSANAFAQLVVKQDGDALIRLGHIADIELGPESSDTSSVFGGLKAVFMGIYTAPTANPLTVISNVRDAMPAIQAQLPSGMKASIAYDATDFINASIEEVIKTLGEAAVIVIVVIFLFLGNLRSTLIPIVTIPLSLIGVMVMLLALGYSINLLTLLALVLAIGLVVDDAIVVVENIFRHIEEGMTPFEASIKGAREIALPVIAMTITLAAVYAPIGFTTGITGALFREFAFTLAGSVIVSGIVALTLSPMLCSKLLNAKTGDTRFTRFINRRFESLRSRYERRLRGTLAAKPAMIMVLFGTIIATGILYTTAQKELAPDEDQGFLFNIISAPEYANLDYLEHYTDQLGEIFMAVPEYANYFMINGSAGVQQAIGGLILKPWSERERSVKQILQELQGKLANIPGIQALAISPPPLPGSTGGAPVQFVITTTGDYEELANLAQELQTAANQSGLFLFTDIDLRFNSPQIEVKIDHDKANRLGVNMREVGASLATMLGGNYVNRFNLAGRSYKTIPQVPREYRMTVDWLNRYEVRTSSGRMVPLSTFAMIEQTVQPNALTTFQQLNSATLSGVPFPGRTQGDVLTFLQQKADEILPEGYSYDYQGESRQYVQEGNTLIYTFVFALIVIFLVLAAQFESFRDPLIILIALPTSMFGALLPIAMIPQLASINIYTQIGLVTLIGLISKHGILMVEFANKLQEEEAMSKLEAIVHAAGVRLRPILMTTAAMVVAMVPLLIADGAGARSRFDIGLVIAAGMTIGTLFTLFVTPAVYVYVARDHHAARERLDALQSGGGAAPAGSPTG